MCLVYVFCQQETNHWVFSAGNEKKQTHMDCILVPESGVLVHDLDSDSNNCSILILIYHHLLSSTYAY